MWDTQVQPQTHSAAAGSSPHQSVQVGVWVKDGVGIQVEEVEWVLGLRDGVRVGLKVRIGVWVRVRGWIWLGFRVRIRVEFGVRTGVGISTGAEDWGRAEVRIRAWLQVGVRIEI